MFSYASEICIEKAKSFQRSERDANIFTSAPSDLGRNQLFNSSTPNGQEAPIAIIAGD
jgi:hypothetical protein